MLERAVVNPTRDPVLQPFDQVLIPMQPEFEMPQSVKITGEVSVRYANGLARTRSKFLFWSSYPEPGPGSMVSVPIKDPAAGVNVTALITSIVGILSSLTTVIVVLTR